MPRVRGQTFIPAAEDRDVDRAIVFVDIPRHPYG